ncbi:MAG TPA: ferritin-like domain-containing protein [Polyangia bacterium]|jgi:hypothetical protein|nr:ferritin-like domain-containing protein [Polyangia bacterium]
MTRTALQKFLGRFVLASTLPLTGCISPPGDCGNLPPEQTIVVRFDGGLPTDGPVTDAGCAELCQQLLLGAGTVKGCEVVPVDGGISALACTSSPICIGGRRPAGLGTPEVAGGDEVGRYLGRMAHLEAASVDAFHRLSAELAAHGAPATLVRAAGRAAIDEVRHARVIGALARHRGVTPPPVEIAPARSRSLAELALENAVEGCVGETWGAIVASWQGRSAGDLRIRAALRRIAVEEAGHAELAVAVARWAEERLTDEERKAVAAAREAAVAQLVEAAGAEMPAELVEVLGLPEPRMARALARAAARELWS